MNRKSGFTLMELLLVVAVLAIVAAAAMPAFFSGATDAMKEARKATLHSAFANVVSSANVKIATALSKGEVLTSVVITGVASGNINHPDGTAKVITITGKSVAADGTITVAVAVTGTGATGSGDYTPATFKTWVDNL